MKLIHFLIPLLAATPASCAGESDGVTKFRLFNYTDTGGPLNWYGLDPVANEACGKGNNQSPIDIDTNAIEYAPAGALKFTLPAIDGVHIENLGFGLDVTLKNGTLEVNNKIYNMVQFHFHTPAEHHVNHEHYPMEVHFVFQTPENETAVVGFFFQLSDTSKTPPLFESVFSRIAEIADPGSSSTTGLLDFQELTAHLDQNRIYQYTGSFTTPPCTEGVAWYLSAEPLPLDVKTYNAVKMVVKFNARYIQNVLGRENLLGIAMRHL
ncbi:alpha carbonic anhydrase [Aspergillus coremiiformis]|uniref:carbonic anhydrase n=1 Tax=Aspergillus coremiiformis TaxID=138285 RepID=A0A5N6Z6T8_9EURO|nr:alpha carbonic anhydrase [Aspergillus coremiiformis]